MGDRIELIYKEISFFMEKSFSFSYLYIAAIFALVAGAKSDTLSFVSFVIQTRPIVLVCCSILTLDLLYLIVSGSCLYSILKRGLFVVNNSNKSETMNTWEGFRRNENIKKGFNLGWNIDNFFMVSMYIVVGFISYVSGSIGLRHADEFARYYLIVVSIAHFIPAWMLWELLRLEMKCSREIKKQS